MYCSNCIKSYPECPFLCLTTLPTTPLGVVVTVAIDEDNLVVGDEKLEEEGFLVELDMRKLEEEGFQAELDMRKLEEEGFLAELDIRKLEEEGFHAELDMRKLEEEGFQAELDIRKLEEDEKLEKGNLDEL